MADEFDFDDDAIESMYDEDSGSENDASRGMLGSTANSFLDDFTGTTPKEGLNTFMNNALPEIAGDKAGNDFKETVNEFTGDLEDSFNSIKKTAKPIVKRLKNKFDKETTIGSGVHKLLGFFEDDSEHSSGMSTEEALNNQIKASIDTALGIYSAERDMSLMEQQINHSMAKSTDEKLAGIQSIVKMQLDYMNNVTRSYYAKSLELGYRSMYIQKDILGATRLGYDSVTKLLEVVVKNTGLPDFVKLRSMEALKHTVREKFTQDMTQSLVGEGSTVSRTIDSLKKGIKKAKDNITVGLTGINEAQEANGEITENMGYGGLVGMSLSGAVKDRIAKLVGKEIRSTETGRKADSAINEFMLDPAAFLKGMEKDTNNKALKWLYGKTGNLFRNTDSIEFSNKIDRESLNAAAMLDNRFYDSVTKTMPMYLSEILKSVESIRLGTEAPAMKYDHGTQTLISTTDVKDLINTKLTDKVTKGGVSKEIIRFVKNLDKEGGDLLTKDETLLVAGKLYDFSQLNLPMTPDSLVNNGFYDLFDNKSIAMKFKLLLERASLNGDGTNSLVKTESLMRSMNSIKRIMSIDDTGIIKDMMDSGYSDQLRDMGILKRDANGNDVIDKKTIIASRKATLLDKINEDFDDDSIVPDIEESRVVEDGYIKKAFNKLKNQTINDVKKLTKESLVKYKTKLDKLYNESFASTVTGKTEKYIRVSLGQMLRIDYRPDKIGGKSAFYMRVAIMAKDDPAVSKQVNTFLDKMPKGTAVAVKATRKLIFNSYTKLLKSDKLAYAKSLLLTNKSALDKWIEENGDITFEDHAKDLFGTGKEKLKDATDFIETLKTGDGRKSAKGKANDLYEEAKSSIADAYEKYAPDTLKKKVKEVENNAEVLGGALKEKKRALGNNIPKPIKNGFEKLSKLSDKKKKETEKKLEAISEALDQYVKDENNDTDIGDLFVKTKDKTLDSIREAALAKGKKLDPATEAIIEVNETLKKTQEYNKDLNEKEEERRKETEKEEARIASEAAKAAALDRDKDGDRDGGTRDQNQNTSIDDSGKLPKDKKSLITAFKKGGLVGVLGALIPALAGGVINAFGPLVSGISGAAGLFTGLFKHNQNGSAMAGRAFMGTLTLIKDIVYGITKFGIEKIPNMFNLAGAASSGFFSIVKTAIKGLDGLLTGGAVGRLLGGLGGTGSKIWQFVLKNKKTMGITAAIAAAYKLWPDDDKITDDKIKLGDNKDLNKLKYKVTYNGEEMYVDAETYSNLTHKSDNIKKQIQKKTDNGVGTGAVITATGAAALQGKNLVNKAKVALHAEIASLGDEAIVAESELNALKAEKAKGFGTGLGKSHLLESVNNWGVKRTVKKLTFSKAAIRSKRRLLKYYATHPNAKLVKAGEAVRKVIRKGKVAYEVLKKVAGGGWKVLKVLKFIPVAGIIIGGYRAVCRIMEGDLKGAALVASEGILSTIPYAGIPLSIATEYLIYKHDEELESNKNKEISEGQFKEQVRDKTITSLHKGSELKVTQTEDTVAIKDELSKYTDKLNRNRTTNGQMTDKYNISDYEEIPEDTTYGVSTLNGKVGYIARLVRKLETEDNYGTVGDIGDGAGISFGAYQFTMASGSLKVFLQNYIKLKPKGLALAKKHLSQFEKSQYKGRLKIFSRWLKRIATTQKGVEAQDITFKSMYYDNAMRHMPKEAKSPIIQFHIIDSFHNGGGLAISKALKSDNLDDVEKLRISYWKHSPNWSKYKNGWLNRLAKIRNLFSSDAVDKALSHPEMMASSEVDGDDASDRPDGDSATSMLQNAVDGFFNLFGVDLKKLRDEKGTGAFKSKGSGRYSPETKSVTGGGKSTKTIYAKNSVNSNTKKKIMDGTLYGSLGVVVENIGEILPSKMNNGHISNITIHCSATPVGKYFDAHDMDAMHKKRGWSGCGYHFVVLLDGTIQYGRNYNKTGAQVKGHNIGNIGICYIGGVKTDGKTDAVDELPSAQLKSLINLAHYLAKINNVPIDAIVGHKEFPNVSKSCPNLTMANIRSAKVITESIKEDNPDGEVPETVTKKEKDNTASVDLVGSKVKDLTGKTKLGKKVFAKSKAVKDVLAGNDITTIDDTQATIDEEDINKSTSKATTNFPKVRKKDSVKTTPVVIKPRNEKHRLADDIKAQVNLTSKMVNLLEEIKEKGGFIIQAPIESSSTGMTKVNEEREIKNASPIAPTHKVAIKPIRTIKSKG